jgi:hypothetical protein
MQNLTVHLGSATPLSSRAGPRAPALSTTPIDRPAPLVSGTTARHCVVAHPSGASLPRSVRPARARAAHVARERLTQAAVGRRPPVGARPHGTPAPTPRTPHFLPPLSPLLRCRRAARSPLALLHSFPSPHSSPTPSLERPSFPTAPRTRTAASSHRQPTLPCGFRPSTAAVCHSSVSSSLSYQSLQFLAIFSPLASLVLQDPTPAVATHRTPLPTDERLRPTPFVPPHHRPAVLVRPCPLLLAQHLPRDPLETSSNTFPPSSHR